MTIPFTCPHCGVQTDVFDQYAGQSGPCVSCGRNVTIPFPSTASDQSPSGEERNLGSRTRTVLIVLAITSGAIIATTILVAVLVALVVPAVTAARRSAQLETCSGNIEAITTALLSYHDEFGHFPPAYVAGRDGKPRHSWRVTILPYLGYQHVYDQYDFSQPWDSPHNMSLMSSMPPEYACPSDPDAKSTFETSYMVVVGPRTAFPGESCVSCSDITDGVESTILVVETPTSGALWLEPADLDATRMVFQVNGRVGVEIGSHHDGGAHVATADGQAMFLWDASPPEDLRGMTTTNGGEPFPWYMLE